jgi:hypothetical protein
LKAIVFTVCEHEYMNIHTPIIASIATALNAVYSSGVVQSWITANPRLKFNLHAVLIVMYFCMSVSEENL